MIDLADLLLVVNDRSWLFDHEVAEVRGIEDGKGQSDAIDRRMVESRTILYDDKAGTQLVIYQCGSCKSECTFAKENLLAEDNYDFMPIYGGEDMLILRRHVDVRDGYRQLRKVKEVWGEPSMRLHHGKSVTELKTFEQIRDVTATDTPLAAQDSADLE